MGQRIGRAVIVGGTGLILAIRWGLAHIVWPTFLIAWAIFKVLLKVLGVVLYLVFWAALGWFATLAFTADARSEIDPD